MKACGRSPIWQHCVALAKTSFSLDLKTEATVNLDKAILAARCDWKAISNVWEYPLNIERITEVIKQIGWILSGLVHNGNIPKLRTRALIRQADMKQKIICYWQVP